MKTLSKVLGILIIFATITPLFAKESILIKSDVTAELEGYDFVSNFEITSDSGRYRNSDLMILPPNEKGFRFLAKNVPEYSTSNYKIIPAYPVFLNEPNIGAGYIYNVSTIKSIKVIFTTNRPYDSISILYSTSVNGPIKKIKMPQDFNSIKSMEENELIFENPLYEPDVKKREIKSTPVLGGDIEGLYFQGIEITTNPACGYSEFSEYSVIYLKEVSVIYDELFTEEQIEQKKILKEDFGIDESAKERIKATNKVREKIRIRENEASLMDKASEEES